MSIRLAPLPYRYSALEPFLSGRSLHVHHSQHQQKYIHRLNRLIAGTRFEHMQLAEIVRRSDGNIFKNAALVWNHDFYWQCLSPNGGAAPHGVLLEAIEDSFVCFESFKHAFKKAAAQHIGSGWVWLVQTIDGSLRIINTRDAATPLVDFNTVPLLTLDVWEHAYYLDYQNDFDEYLENFWRFINWAFVCENFERYNLETVD